MREVTQRPEEVKTTESDFIDYSPGMTLKSTITGRLLFVTHITDNRIRGVEINTKGELANPDKANNWQEIDPQIAKKNMVEVQGVDVSKIQYLVVGRISTTMN